MEAARKIVQIDEVGPSRSRKSRRSSLVGALVVLALVATAAGAFFFWGTEKLTTIKDYEVAAVNQGALTVSSSASGTVVLPQTITVAAPQTGYADKVLVQEGDTVKLGQVLATLKVPDLEDDLADLKAQLKVAQIAYDDLVNDWEYTLATDKTTLARLVADIATAQKDVDTKKELAGLKSSRQTEYEEALETLEGYQNDRDDAQAKMTNDQKKREIELAKQKATIEQIQTSLNRTLADIEEAKIKSPLAGEVLSIESALMVPGSLIDQYDELMEVANRSSTYIDLEVNETDAGSLKVGDKLTLTVSTKTVSATITSVGKVASLSSDGLTATVTVRVKPLDAGELTPGASAAATINLGTKADALTLPRGAFLTTGSQKYVYVVEGNVARKTAVTFGTLQSNTVEVKSGLKAGDVVIVSGYQDFIDQDTVQIQNTEGATK